MSAGFLHCLSLKSNTPLYFFSMLANENNNNYYINTNHGSMGILPSYFSLNFSQFGKLIQNYFFLNLLILFKSLFILFNEIGTLFYFQKFSTILAQLYLFGFFLFTFKPYTHSINRKFLTAFYFSHL